MQRPFSRIETARTSVVYVPSSRRRGVLRHASRNDRASGREETSDENVAAFSMKELARKAQGFACTACAAAVLATAAPGAHAETKLPPLDTDPMRCERAFDGNTLGMANGLSDRLLDFRFCDLHGTNLAGKTLSGALMVGADFSKSNMAEVVMSKAYAVDSNFEGANLQNAVLDRVEFKRANLKGVNFINAVITGISWEGADLTDAVFEDALISVQDVKEMCLNPTLKGDSRVDVGCKN